MRNGTPRSLKRGALRLAPSVLQHMIKHHCRLAIVLNQVPCVLQGIHRCQAGRQSAFSCSFTIPCYLRIRGKGHRIMRARHLLQRSVPLFSIATMQAVNQAFDSAWAALGPRYHGDANASEDARLKLAECILAVTKDGATNAAQIERLALQMFQVSR
jgi:hypothetical protein